jgi:hypothetical protein
MVDGLKIMFNKKPAWLRAALTRNRFKIPHSTCTNRLPIIMKKAFYNTEFDKNNLIDVSN